MENFCLGTHRLEIYGGAPSLRRGWATLAAIDNPPMELARVETIVRYPEL